MKKQDLVRLLSFEKQPPSALKTSEPRLAALVTNVKREARRSELDAILAAAPESVRKHVAELDLTAVEPEQVFGKVRESLAGAGMLDPSVGARLGAGALGENDEDDEPSPEPQKQDGALAADPDIAPLLDRARLYQVGEIAKLSDATVDAIAAVAPTPARLTPGTLSRLVAQGTLSDVQARETGLAARVYHLSDGQAALASTLRSASFAKLGGRPATSTRELATLGNVDWQELLARTPGALEPGQEAVGVASTLAARFAALHPADAFVGRLPRVAGNDPVALRKLVPFYPKLGLAEVLDDPALDAATRISTVAKRVGWITQLHTELGDDLFDLDLSPDSADRARLDALPLDATPEERDRVVATLGHYQRSLALTRHVDDAQRVLAAGYRGAASVAKDSLPDFVAKTGVPIGRAVDHWRKAAKSRDESGQVFGSILDLRAGLFDRLRINNLGPDAREYLRKLPGYASLFGSLAYCTCAHCQSVLGPAAYFVDLMTYVSDNILPVFRGLDAHPLDLRVRRPDLWTFALTCKNTDDRIPTLDLVNEVLERHVSGVVGGAGGSGSRENVYQRILPSTVSSFAQPFHLALRRISALLAERGSSRSEVARALGAGEDAVAAAELDLSRREWSLLEQRVSDLATLAGLYDLDWGGVSGIARLDVQDVVRATGLSRDELAELVTTRFVAASRADVRIVAQKEDPDKSIQNDIELVEGLSADALDRMHRFTRLRRALPWTTAELDHVLTALAREALDAAALREVARVRFVQRSLGASVDETCSLFGPMPDVPTGVSLFDAVFNPPDFPRGKYPPPQKAEVVLPWLQRTGASADIPRLLAGLGIDLEELSVLQEHLAEALETNDDPAIVSLRRAEKRGHFLLTRLNLTLLYRHVRLARRLGVSITDLFQLIRFAGVRRHVGGLSDLMDVLDFHAWWRSSGFTLDRVAVITGEAPRDGSRFPDPEAIAASLVVRASELLTFRDTIFAVASGVTESASRALLLENREFLEPVEATPEGLEPTLGSRWRLRAGVSLAGADLRVPEGAMVSQPQGEPRAVRVEELREALAAHSPDRTLAIRLGAALSIDPEKAAALASLAGHPLDDAELARTLHAAPEASGAATAPAQISELMRQLARAVRPLAVAFAAPVWDRAALDFVRQRPEVFGASLPTLTLSSLRALSAYERIARHLNESTSPELAAATARLREQLAGFDATTGTFPGALAASLGTLLGVGTNLVAALRERFAAPITAAQALDGLDRAARLGAMLGVEGAALSAIADAGFAATNAGEDVEESLERAADALRVGLRRRHSDEAERQAVLARVDEPLRERRRDALVAYLLHSVPFQGQDAEARPRRPWRSAEDLYQYFLIDVSAGGCASTSRVVSATSSVQLYVQRVIMHLEQTDADAPRPVWAQLNEPAASEWFWRKNYRVWEANRKIFLWPENYLEPDLRDAKTPLFEELESELLQTDLTEQNVVDAYAKYLRGFEELATLRLAGAYHDIRENPSEGEPADVLHLFGVAATDPPTYYYRTCEDLRAGEGQGRTPLWSPWRKVDVQITARRLSPVVFEGRLHLFWTSFVTRPINSEVVSGNSSFVGYQHKMSVQFTTLRSDGSWTTPQLLELPHGRDFNPSPSGHGGRGIVEDRKQKNDVPRLAGRAHPEPVDGYTLRGPNWDWVWFEVFGESPDQELRIRFRNFLLGGTVDLFHRRIDAGDVFETFPAETRSPFPVLVVRGDKLCRATPFELLGNLSAATNLLLAGGRLTMLGREWLPLRQHTDNALEDAEVLAHLGSSLTREILAVPGSPTDIILQQDGDLLYLQGPDAVDDGYSLFRFGTTLSESLGRALFAGGLDALLTLPTKTERGVRVFHEAGHRLRLLREIDDATTSRGSRIDYLDGPYRAYYEELFFHIPFSIANALNSRGRFAEAQRWYHYIFDPTAKEAAIRGIDRSWRYIGFQGLSADKLRDTLRDADALRVYHEDPGNPHAIARLRATAYQKAILMKYVDNLIDWGDHLFRQFTTESVNEALMLYVMASDILGPRPPRLGDCGESAVTPRSYERIAREIDRDEHEEVLIEIETLVASGKKPRRRPSSPQAPDHDGISGKLRDAVKRFRFEAGPQPVPGGGVTDPLRERLESNPLFRGVGFKTARAGSWAPALGAGTRRDSIYPLARVFDRPLALGPASGLDAANAVLKRGAGAAASLSTDATRDGTRLFARELDIQLRLNVPPLQALPTSITRQLSPVFCFPVNPDLLAYWDRIEGQLYKIRHCQDIDGQARELALFAPEIDPRLLVQARAAGLSLEDVLGATSGSLPPYRFLYLIDRAKAFAASLSGFGGALLSALEKKDGEQLARLRLIHQQNLTRMTTQLRRWEIETADEAYAALERQRDAAEYRCEYFRGLIDQNRNGWEIAQSTARHAVSGIQVAAAAWNFNSAVLHQAPQVGSPFALTYGGIQYGSSFTAAASALGAVAAGLEAVAASTALEAGFDRRSEGWEHQRTLALHDLRQINRNLRAAEFRRRIAKRALELHEKSIEQLDEMLAVTDGKFSSFGLYTWMSTQLRRIYRDGYNNALALAKLAEQAFRFERGNEDAPRLEPTYWDPLHAGLLAGEQLLIALEGLERRYLETNYRSLEVDQAFALSQIAPDALVALRERGECRFVIPELAFDLYYPGHYKRRIRAVRLTAPCITGPYVNVSATLTLDRSWMRPTPSAGLVEVPPRRSVSIATSTAQNDAGVFELSFRDERYMPFEGAGAISAWHVALPRLLRQFDYHTINDIIISISYSAEQDRALRERVEAGLAAVVAPLRDRLVPTGVDGSLLEHLQGNDLARLFSLRQDFSSSFTRLLHAPAGTAVRIEISPQHFPSFLAGRDLQVSSALLAIRSHRAPTGLVLSIDEAQLAEFPPQARLGGLPGTALPPSFVANLRGTHVFTVGAAGSLAPETSTPGDVSALDADALADLLIYVEYRVA